MPRSLSRLLHLAAGLAALLTAGPATAFTTEEARTPMRVTLVRSDLQGCGTDCPEWLALTGKIGFETPALLSAALSRLKGRKIPVLLDSPGGEGTAGLAMGRMLRAAKLDAVVATTVLTDCGTGDAACLTRLRAGVRPGHIGAFAPPACASACVFVLAGGVRRVVPYDAYVGVHQALQVLTYRPVMNTFRVLKRRIGGRVVEVSRTLVASRALPTRVVKGAAPASLYSTFDHFLLGMGIGEAIMPLMRATPPSGIHWLSRTEMIETHIVTDANDGMSFVRQVADETSAAAAAATARGLAQAAAVHPVQVPAAKFHPWQAPAAALRPGQAPAALTLDDGRRWTGIVTWRVDPTTHDVPVLVGDWTVPGRHLHGAIEIMPEPDQATGSSFALSARFMPEAVPDAASVLSIVPPRICDLGLCWQEFPDARTLDQSTGVFHVSRIWRDDFLKQLHERNWMVFDVRTDDGRGQVAVTLSSLENHAIDIWEKLCCNFTAASAPWTAPDTMLPALPDPRRPFLVPGFGPVTPAVQTSIASEPAIRRVDAVALFDAYSNGPTSEPERLKGSATWTSTTAPGRPRRPDETMLIGAANVPGAGLQVSLRVKISAPGVMGRLTAEIRATSSANPRFGAPSRLTILAIDDRQRHSLLLASSVVGDGPEGGYLATFDVPETGAIAGAFQLAFEDEQQRRITIAIPIDPATAALLQAAARGDDPTRS